MQCTVPAARPYHSLLHHCRPDSLFPRHIGRFQECSGSYHTGDCSPPSYDTQVHPSGPDNEAPHHTPGPAQCTSSHARTETGLQNETTITALAGLDDEAPTRGQYFFLKRKITPESAFYKSVSPASQFNVQSSSSEPSAQSTSPSQMWVW